MAPLQLQLANTALRRVIQRLHFPLEVMLVYVRWYAAYPLSLRQLEEMMTERGVCVDHATIHRWALKILPVLAAVFRTRKRSVGRSWRVDETYILVGGQWKYLYRAVDQLWLTVDFLLTARRDEAAARRFLEPAIKRRVRPMLGLKSFWTAHRIIAGIETMHMIRKGQMNGSQGSSASAAQQFYSLAH